MNQLSLFSSQQSPPSASPSNRIRDANVSRRAQRESRDAAASQLSERQRWILGAIAAAPDGVTVLEVAIAHGVQQCSLTQAAQDLRLSGRVRLAPYRRPTQYPDGYPSPPRPRNVTVLIDTLDYDRLLRRATDDPDPSWVVIEETPDAAD